MKFSFIILFILSGFISLPAQNFLTKIDTIHRFELYFDSGDSILQEKADTMLRTLRLFSRYAKYPSVCISAHTDNIGSREANKSLSLARALHVDSLIRRMNLPIDSIYTSYSGEEYPKQSNDTEEGRRTNRRVIVYLIKDKEMVLIKRRFLDSIDHISKDIKVRYQSDYKNGYILPDSSGLFELYTPLGEPLSLFFFKKGYMFGEELVLPEPEDIAVVELQIEKLQNDMEANIMGLNFYGGSDKILKYHSSRLQDLLDFMLLNDKISILIKGHVNRPGEPPAKKNTFTYRLGEDRAKAVFMHLMKNGVHPDRMKYVSFANWELLYPEPKNVIENRKNRRVEIRITGLDFEKENILKTEEIEN